ncbi:MAG: hypothetical protein JST04_11070 [Bdellovibrionales bacterium]|nr:hypothetical protein [Bdellovibrionales bacterium]
MRKKSIKSVWRIAIRSVAFAGVFLYLSPTFGDMFAGPSDTTKDTLNTWHYFLEIMKSENGKYPTSLKEIKAFRKNVAKEDCQMGKVLCQSQMYYVDGWKTPLEYKSNGKTYRVTGSHGYFLTEKTKAKGNQEQHWDNTGTPPVDPPPRSDTI